MTNSTYFINGLASSSLSQGDHQWVIDEDWSQSVCPSAGNLILICAAPTYRKLINVNGVDMLNRQNRNTQG